MPFKNITDSEHKKYLAKAKKLEKTSKTKGMYYSLSIAFKHLGFNAIAREISAGRNVKANALMGLNMAHNDPFGPRYDFDKREYVPQTVTMRKLEHRLLNLINAALRSAGETPFNKEELVKKFRTRDKAFEMRVRDRK